MLLKIRCTNCGNLREPVSSQMVPADEEEEMEQMLELAVDPCYWCHTKAIPTPEATEYVKLLDKLKMLESEIRHALDMKGGYLDG
jgi:hypothetical protein